MSPERLDAVELSVGRGVPFDRRYAVTHGASDHDPANPRWLPRRNFLVLARSPRLAALTCACEPGTGRLAFGLPNRGTLSVGADDTDVGARLEEVFSAHVSSGQRGPFGLASLGEHGLTDSPLQGVSLMSSGSLAELERALGERVDRRRFRGNVWFDGGPAWVERDWIGKTLRAGETRLEIVEEIERCAAIDAEPGTGARDLPLLSTLREHCGHVNFGVLAKVVTGGGIAVGDAVSIVGTRAGA